MVELKRVKPPGSAKNLAKEDKLRIVAVEEKSMTQRLGPEANIVTIIADSGMKYLSPDVFRAASSSQPRRSTLMKHLSASESFSRRSTSNPIFEICVESAAGAIAAQKGGGHRVELCANLLEGGTTPSAGAIKLARQSIDIGIYVMIRPRGGDFCYSPTEFEVMKLDIETAKQSGTDGVVFGILREDGTIDIERTRELMERARPLGVTFHRAFDMTRDPHQALEDLINLGVDRVLTSGQEITVLEGLDLITDLIKQAGDRIIVMPGGGITEKNIKKIIDRCRPREIHFAALAGVESPMKYRNDRVFMGGELRPPEYTLIATDPERVHSCMDSATRL
jgi:copper homeostasis protein